MSLSKLRVNASKRCDTISPKGGKNDTKRINLFNAKIILFTKKLKQFREQTI